MPTYRFIVTLTLKGPVLTKSTAPEAYGLDAPFARNADRKLYIPGTLVKGRMRQAFKELSDYGMPDPRDWFGPNNDKDVDAGNRKNTDGRFERFNTRLHVSDFVLDAPTTSTWRRRIRQDSVRHAADEQMLQVLESPIPAGKSGEFSGAITFEARGAVETSQYVRFRLMKALKWAGCMGANTSVGFGVITNVKVDPEPLPPPASVDPAPTGKRLHLALTTKDLLCLTEQRAVAENLFETGMEISGATLKGAIAAQWMRSLGQTSAIVRADSDTARSELCETFERLRFTHARPSGDSKMPIAIPLSLGWTSDQFRDFALDPDPPADLNDVVAFQRDWKDDVAQHVAKLCGWPEKKTELRVRTAIDYEKGKAKENYLFAYEMIRPLGLRWHCTVDFGAIEDDAKRSQARAQLVDLIARGIHGVGKTKATLNPQLLDNEPEPAWPSDLAPRDGKWIVTLQTPALIVDPLPLTGSRDPGLLLERYRKAFGELSHQKLVLLHFFALHDLRGGLYLYKRFQQGRPEDKYEPYLLTRAGSVFVFTHRDGQENEASGEIEEWYAHGLPVPAWANTRFGRNGRDGAHWSNNPYVPQNGYGEIAVNLKITQQEVPNNA